MLRVDRVCFDADLVAFDKDGTLIDFEFMWGRMAQAWAEHLAPGREGEAMRQEVHRAWGFDLEGQRTRPQSPLAIASTGQLRTIAAATLYRHGVPWPEAEDRTRAAFLAAETDPELALTRLVRPAGDVLGLLQRLRAAGIRAAVVTTDGRRETEETLRLLGVAHLVDATVCGDDGVAVKPAPDMLLVVCRQLGIEPARTAVVGDTEGDLLMAERAGAGLRVAVLSGAGDPGFLERHADAVIPSIDGIRVEL